MVWRLVVVFLRGKNKVGFEEDRKIRIKDRFDIVYGMIRECFFEKVIFKVRE